MQWGSGTFAIWYSLEGCCYCCSFNEPKTSNYSFSFCSHILLHTKRVLRWKHPRIILHIFAMFLKKSILCSPKL